MSSFNNNKHTNDDGKMNELAHRLSKIKNPSGQDPCSLATLQARHESLKGPKTHTSLENLNSRFTKLEGGESGEGVSVPPIDTAATQRVESIADDTADDDDDFLSFINDSLSMNMTAENISHKTNHPHTLSSVHTYNENHLHATETKSDVILEDINRSDNMSRMEDLLCDSQSTSEFMSAHFPVGNTSQGSRVIIPDKDKSELDLLLEQTKDESRLLRNPITSSHAGPSEDLTENDQITELIMAARDAAYLDKKYGGVVDTNTTTHTTSSKNKSRRVDDNDNDDDYSEDGGRSYGSMISDESSLSDSD